MDDTKVIELRKCPLCGGEAEIKTERHTPFMCKYGRCKQCGATGMTDDSYYGARIAWNTMDVEPAGALARGLSTHVNYQTYIESDEWQQKAAAAKARVGFRCQVCNRHQDDEVLDAHHRTYERLGNEEPEDITILCRTCHDLFERHKRLTKNAG